VIEVCGEWITGKWFTRVAILLRLPDSYLARRTRKKVDGLPELLIALALFSIIAFL
jgi:prepilin-type N-terminal cleavage/methylation domain-containing protein